MNKKFSKDKIDLIELSDDSMSELSDIECSDNDTPNEMFMEDCENTLVPIEYYVESAGKSEVKEGFMEITLVKKDVSHIQDKDLLDFIKFCVKNKLFDDTFYDYGNVFSILATKLPETFKDISKNDGYIKKKRFVSAFKRKYKYKGNLDYVYNIMDQESTGEVTWENFKEFFLPFIKNVTM